jgi:predicted phosphodiesterase
MFRACPTIVYCFFQKKSFQFRPRRALGNSSSSSSKVDVNILSFSLPSRKFAVSLPRFFFPFVHRRSASFILIRILLMPGTRILVLTDLHANATALDAVLSAAEGRWDISVCLGDVVGYGPDPNEVTARIRALGATTIRGNHDKAISGIMDTIDFNPVARAAVDWTRATLDPDHLSWLAALSPGPFPTDGIVLIHGAYQDEDEYVFTPSQAMDGLLDSSSSVTFFGHTHHQGGFSYLDSTVELLQIRPRPTESSTALRLEPGRRYLLNPGSVGQPRDGDPRAAFAIADLEHQIVEFWRVPYDIPAVQQRMRGARLPEPLAQRLALGR